MTFAEFHNGLRVFTSIDGDEFAAAIGDDDPALWERFEANPHDFFVRSPDARAKALFAIITERNAKSAVVQASLEAEDPA